MQYVIQRGDTLSAIAKRFGIPQAEIMRINGIDNPNKIYAGHIIEIPPSLLPTLSGTVDKFLKFIGIQRS